MRDEYNAGELPTPFRVWVVHFGRVYETKSICDYKENMNPQFAALLHDGWRVPKEQDLRSLINSAGDFKKNNVKGVLGRCYRN